MLENPEVASWIEKVAPREYCLAAQSGGYHANMKYFQAIAAMAENRVIGSQGQIPWHLSEDFKWFKQKTLGHVLVMGRKTFESIGKPLPQRQTIVLSQGTAIIPGVIMARAWGEIDPNSDSRQFFICGGARVYAEGLPKCSDLFLTMVKRSVPGDTYFPPFEDQFELVATIKDLPEFKILHYKRLTNPA